MQEPTRAEWIEITAALAAPFPADDIELRWERPGKVHAGDRAAVLAYVTARAIQERLDAVVPGAWEFTYDVLATGAKGITVAKGVLTVYGLRREDIGEASNLEGNKGCVSACLKRAGVQWGIGRYLYRLPKVAAVADGEARIPEAWAAKWREAYTRKFAAQLEADRAVMAGRMPAIRSAYHGRLMPR